MHAGTGGGVQDGTGPVMGSNGERGPWTVEQAGQKAFTAMSLGLDQSWQIREVVSGVPGSGQGTGSGRSCKEDLRPYRLRGWGWGSVTSGRLLSGSEKHCPGLREARSHSNPTGWFMIIPALILPLEEEGTEGRRASSSTWDSGESVVPH